MSMANLSFEELQKKCLKEGRLFEDPDFPAIDKSIYLSEPVSKNIVWKRPHELCKNPKFIVNEATRFDLDQGSLGNCWFIAAAATLATKPQLLEKVVPMQQSFTENYAGIFRFNFWRYGEWTEVIIDDRLPAKYGKTLEFCHNNEEPDEFWSALLEKAYAKLNGSYEALLGGNIQDAMVDLTGGVSEAVDLRDKSRTNETLYSTMETLDSTNTLMGCCISILGKSGADSYDKGLMSGHAYSITGLTTATISGNIIRLIRLLNPWGRAEWSGPWSDSSTEWKEIADDFKKRIQLKALEDGEFWMAFDDWRAVFTHLQICYLTTSYFDSKLEWLQESTHGSWIKGVNAGGCGCTPNEKFYWNNPQYCIVANEPGTPSSPLIISLMQKEKRGLNSNSGSCSSNITIGFRLFRITKNEPIHLDNTIFPKETVILEKGIYEKFREVAHKYYDITSGTYCVIPTTYSPNEEASFFLRVLSHQKTVLIDPSKMQNSKEKMSGFGMSGGGVTEPYMTSVKVQDLGQAMSWGSSPEGEGDEGGGESGFEETLTPAERDVLEVYEAFAMKTQRQSVEVDFDLLRRILTSLNDIGQLGGYKIYFSDTECKILHNMVTSWQNRRILTFEQVRKIVAIIKHWVRVFSQQDQDFSEFIPFCKLWKSLSSLGFELDDRTKEAVTLSYATNTEGLFVTDFIRCAAKIHATNVYWKAKTQYDSCNMSLQELLERVLLT